MKKNYVSLLTGCLVFFTANVIFAQAPTITSAMLPLVGTSYTIYSDSLGNDTTGFVITPGSSATQTWNYAPNFITTYSTMHSYISPFGLPGASSFPGANLADSSYGEYNFYTAGTNGLIENGYYVNIPGFATYTATFTPMGEIVIPTPFTYSDTITNNFSFTYTYSSIGYIVRQTQHTTLAIIADAFGSLTTPAGTYFNTLRIKNYQVDVDSQFLYSTAGVLLSASPYSKDSAITYEWLDNNHPFPLMEIILDGAGTAIKKAFYTQSVTTGVENHTSPFASLSLYPNPAIVATSLTYQNKYATHVNIDMFDISGRLITNLANENQSAGPQTLPIDTKALGLNAGLYFVRISGPEGSETVKLSVN